ncbi:MULTISPECIES: GNAT family N-acetyltransferase [Roseomonadaceae]|nr:GNAT family N-acetyltransferase [Roseomonas oleicola]
MTVIRSAMPGDLPGLLALYPHLNPGDPAPDPARAEAAWGEMLAASPLVTVIVAERYGDIVASCILIRVPNLTVGARPYAVIENVVTHAAHRCEGLGQAVLAAALEAAWAANCYKVSLATGSHQESTLRFYEKAGFTRNAKTFFEVRRI